MGTEASARLVCKLLILCLTFTLYQLGSEFRYQSIAQELSYEEVSVLQDIADKLGLKGPSFRISFCNESSYNGIKCDCSFENYTVCHITKIELIASGLTGVVPKELVNLTHLESLNLRMNELSGSIPASLGNLPLYYLDLSSNQLTGSIPDTLGNMKFKPIFMRCKPDGESNRKGGFGSRDPSKGSYFDCNGAPTNRDCYKDCKEILVNAILTLDLSSNQLSGSIPATLGTVDEYLSGDKNRGSIEGLSYYMRNKTSLLPVFVEYSSYHIDLSNNNINDSIPSSFGNLSFASTYIDLDNNGISGDLPEALRKLKNLEYFTVESNRIGGRIPKSFADLKKLRKFSAAGNYLVGPFPDFIANWTDLEELYLNGNNFKGKIPAGIFNLSSLRSLAISDVEFSHFQFPPSMPKSFPGITLRNLILRKCSITGEIPSYFGNLTSLKNIDLSFNNLTGRIPDSLKNLSLSYMWLSHNKLTGKIPDWIQNVSRSEMDLSYNYFSELSFSPSPDSNLNLFSCCCNSSASCLQDTMHPTGIQEQYCPRGKPNYHSLFINCGGGETKSDGNIYEQDNDTSQFYLSPKGNWARISSGNVGIKNATCGVSSEAVLYNRARTTNVSLTYYGFCLRNGKYSVTLHFVEIVPEDTEYKNTRPRVFDVYIQGQNKLRDFNMVDKARHPNKVQNFTAVEVNDSTLEINFYWAGKGTNDHGPLISAISVTPEYRLHKQLPRLQIALITVASVIVFLLLLLLFAWMTGWLPRNTDHLQKICIGLKDPITLKQLKYATRNFSKTTEIGQEIFGTVYKAEVQGKTVAVKKLSSHSSEEMINQLKMEYFYLKSLRHENLVQLLDVYNAKGMHLLIYEYMQNNSLAHALFDPKSKVKLDWKARFNICLGIARGLEYLHDHPGRKIVHRDIKPANILLDGELNAKISDFGSACLYTEDNQFNFIKGEVTEGYMAPEYIQGVVTTKADVYSFGVVILETVSGRKNAGHERDSQETEYLIDTACDLHRKGRLVDLVDKSIPYDAKDAIIILNLAVMCVNISAKMRPTMSEVVSVLNGDKRIDEISPALVSGINDPHIKEIAEFAVSEHNKKSGKKLELQSVVEGDTHQKYRLVIAVKDTKELYESSVCERGWEHTKELLSFDQRDR